MKFAPLYYLANTNKVEAYQQADLDALSAHLKTAKNMWHEDWVAQGSQDRGSCCVGKGITAYYVGPRKRIAEPVNIVSCNWVQGNISASQSVDRALKYLRHHGIECWYNDGQMD